MKNVVIGIVGISHPFWKGFHRGDFEKLVLKTQPSFPFLFGWAFIEVSKRSVRVPFAPQFPYGFVGTFIEDSCTQ